MEEKQHGGTEKKKWTGNEAREGEMRSGHLSSYEAKCTRGVQNRGMRVVWNGNCVTTCHVAR